MGTTKNPIGRLSGSVNPKKRSNIKENKQISAISLIIILKVYIKLKNKTPLRDLSKGVLQITACNILEARTIKPLF